MYEAHQEWSEILHSIDGIKEIRRTWVKDFVDLPVVVYLETDNMPSVMTGEGESTSIVQFTIHIFTQTYKEGRQLVREINEKAQNLLWQRMMFQHLPEEDREHFMLMFQTEVDLETGEKFIRRF